MYEVWNFLAGLGLFLYGISSIENALRDLGGRNFVNILRRHTKNRIESVATGTILTALLQSSSLVSLMVLAFVGSQFIPMQNALGIIIGANLGTTFTGWIVTIFGFKLNIEQYSLPIIALGALGLTFIQNNKRSRSKSKLIFGFGMLLFGLGFMKSGMENIVTYVDITTYTQHHIIYFFLLGIVVTAIIQSSSAMMAITLSALSIDSISLPQAAATVIGADLGTTITVVLGALSGASTKKQVAYFHVLFNVIIDFLTLISMPALLYLIANIFNVTDSLFALVLFHNIFNAIGIIIFLPLLPIISKHIKTKFIENSDTHTFFIQNVDTKLPTLAFEAAQNEIEGMIVQTIKYNMQILNLSSHEQSSILKDNDKFIQIKMPKKERYIHIKQLESEIITFLIDLKNSSLSKNEMQTLALWTASVRNLVHSALSIKTIRHDLADLVRFDDEGSFENKHELIENTKNLYKNVLETLKTADKYTVISQLAELDSINESTHDKLVKYIYNKYKRDFSTPLNVVRELYSSNKALINSLKEYKLDAEIITTFDNLPSLVR